MTEPAPVARASSDADVPASAPRAADALLARPAVVRALMVAVGVLGAVPQFRSWLTPDVAWYLYASRRMLDGARLYVDVVDINPPLVILLSAPAAAIGRWLGVADVQVLRVLVLLLIAGSLLLAAALLGRALGAERRGTTHALLLLWLFALLPLTREDFGQREHLMLALALPYLAAAMARASGERPPVGLAALAGALAGVGMALKPHFGLLWLAVEGYLWGAARCGPPWRRVESVTAAVVPLVYGAAVVVVVPAYLDFVRILGGSYAAYLSNSPLAILVHEPWAAFTVAALLAALALRPADPAVARVTDLLAVATAALLLVALAQQKGWRYHLYPAFATATVLLGVLSLARLRDARSPGARVYAALSRILVAGVVVAIGAHSLRQAASPGDDRYQPYPEFRELLGLVRDRRASGDSGLLVLSNNLRASFPLVNYGDAAWASRFNAAWLLGAVYGPELMAGRTPVFHDQPHMTAAERYLIDAMAEDLARVRPTLLIVERPLTGPRVNPVRRLDYLAYFRRDERLAREFARYRKTRDVGEFEVYERIAGRTPE